MLDRKLKKKAKDRVLNCNHKKNRGYCDTRKNPTTASCLSFPKITEDMTAQVPTPPGAKGFCVSPSTLTGGPDAFLEFQSCV